MSRKEFIERYFFETTRTVSVDGVDWNSPSLQVGNLKSPTKGEVKFMQVKNPASTKAVDKLFGDIPKEYAEYLLSVTKDGYFENVSKDRTDWRKAKKAPDYVYLNVLYGQDGEPCRTSDVILLHRNGDIEVLSANRFTSTFKIVGNDFLSIPVPIEDTVDRIILLNHQLEPGNCSVSWWIFKNR